MQLYDNQVRALKHAINGISIEISSTDRAWIDNRWVDMEAHMHAHDAHAMVINSILGNDTCVLYYKPEGETK